MSFSRNEKLNLEYLKATEFIIKTLPEFTIEELDKLGSAIDFELYDRSLRHEEDSEC